MFKAFTLSSVIGIIFKKKTCRLKFHVVIKYFIRFIPYIFNASFNLSVRNKLFISREYQLVQLY